MAPGKTPASPTSRPIVVGHKSEAQQSQVAVSGIGAAEPRDTLDFRQKIEITPSHHLDSAESTPKISVRQKETDRTAIRAATSAMQPSTADATTPQTPEAKSRNDALAALAMDPEPPAPAPPAPTQPIPPIPELPPDDPMHGAASPSLDHQVVVSHHTTASASTWKLFVLLTLAVLFAFLVLDILLDAGAINSSAIPHTNFF